jgi:hypothetical protein
MANENLKRGISLAVWGLGILGGLWGCVAYVGAMFVVGGNDSPQEVRALTFALATTFPACILALWQRVIAGAWLVFSGTYYIYGMLIQRAYMIEVRHFDNQLSVAKTVEASLFLAGPLLVLGTFGIATDLLRWPSVWKRQSSLYLEKQELK